ncbi:unnamed protein product [Anisakis simplex]|uniref:Anaphase-promoting complex subunit 5 n=1 Tax=Anisakis simplex TaxID=6269 RepID=A0A0M3K5M2_ANISI|nr:unnamed protein product [Anisakis simplex]
MRAIDSEHRQNAFATKQLCDLSNILYSLISAVNLSFNEMCQIIEKPLEKISPNLYKNFLKKVDEHRGDVEVLIRRDHLLQQLKRSDRTHPFITPKSVFGIFVRKLAVKHSLQSVYELERLHAEWLNWLNDKKSSIRFDIFGEYSNLSLNSQDDGNKLMLSAERRNNVPFGSLEKSKVAKNINTMKAQFEQLLSSSRAHNFISRQLRLLQVSPDEAMPSEQLLMACEFIKANYPHLAVVHLLEMLDGIRHRNGFASEHSLREYFDLITMHINECQSNAINITSVDIRPLRYAPILHARLARIFSDREHARNLLIEAVQQAQANRDLLCLRLAVVEQAAIDSLVNSHQCLPVNHQSNMQIKSTFDGSTDRLTSIYKVSLVMLMSMWASENSAEDNLDSIDDEGDGDDRRSSSSETRAFVRQLRDCSTLLNCIELAITAENHQTVRSGLQSCTVVDYGVGNECSTRLVNEAARAVAITLKLQNGFVSNAMCDANILLYLNTGDNYCKRYDTEAQVIAAVNIVYGHAMNGHYSNALSILENIKRRFTLKNNWICAMHWKRCECLVEFDKAFMFGEWNNAQKWLLHIRTLAPDEANLRKSVLQFCEGYIPEAIDLAVEQVELCNKSKDVRLKLRSEMVLAMIYAASSRLFEARTILQRCRITAKQFHLDNFEALIIRRLASIDAIEGRMQSALSQISACEWLIKTRCSRIENALMQLTVFMSYAKCKLQSLIKIPDIGNLLENQLVRTRNECRRASVPLLEKALLIEAAKLFNRLERIQLRDDCAEAYHEIDLKCSSSLNWIIL